MKTLPFNGSIFGNGCKRSGYTKLVQQFGDMKAFEEKKPEENSSSRNSVERKMAELQICHSLSDGGPNDIHRIKDIQLSDIKLEQIYETQSVISEGCFAKIILAKHRNTESTIVLKAIYSEFTPHKDFLREYHYSYHLGHHPHIVDSYNVSFKCEDSYMFAQEYAPYGDLAGHVRIGGLPETACKSIGKQLALALDFMHSKQLVHRDVKLENVLVFAPDFSKVKLCNFGATRKEGSLVDKLMCNWLSFLSPEIYDIVKNERYICKTSSDTWQLGVLLFVCLTGSPPWQMADSIRDQDYSAFKRYQKRKTAKIPNAFRRLAPRALRMFRRIFEHNPECRAPVTEVCKYMKDNWLEGKLRTSSSCSHIVSTSTVVQERKDSLKLYIRNPDGSRHSQENNNRHRSMKIMNMYGLDTTIDHKAVTQRVWEWILTCDVNAEHVESI